MVYVDQPQPCISTRKWKWGTVTHLVADTEVELDALALHIGLKPEWRQQHEGQPAHYDLTEGKRAQAVSAGAVDLQSREECYLVLAKLGFFQRRKLEVFLRSRVSPERLVFLGLEGSVTRT